VATSALNAASTHNTDFMVNVLCGPEPHRRREMGWPILPLCHRGNVTESTSLRWMS
jgi:hypothetical protein